MSSQFTNNYMTAPTSLNLYITRKLNNMDKAKLFKKEHDNWTQLYHKILKGLEAIINVQKQAKNIMKIAEETDITITESERTILKVSINNQTINTMNILGISENLQYLIQSNMEDWAYQVQQILANKLDKYKGQGNKYMDNNIQEIQELYSNERQKKELEGGKVEDKEVILIRLYKVSTDISKTTVLSFIYKEIKNLE